MTPLADPAFTARRYARRGAAFLIVGSVASAAVFWSQTYRFSGPDAYVVSSGLPTPYGLALAIIQFALGALNYLPHFCFALGAMYLGVGIVLRALAAGWFRPAYGGPWSGPQGGPGDHPIWPAGGTGAGGAAGAGAAGAGWAGPGWAGPGTGAAASQDAGAGADAGAAGESEPREGASATADADADAGTTSDPVVESKPKPGTSPATPGTGSTSADAEAAAGAGAGAGASTPAPAGHTAEHPSIDAAPDHEKPRPSRRRWRWVEDADGPQG